MTTANKAIAEISADSKFLISELSRMNRGDVAEYATHFTQWLGRPIRGREDLPNFCTVENHLRNDYDIVLSVIRGVGYRILSHSETLANDVQVERARRAARRRKKELVTIDIGEFTEQQRLDYVCKVTQAHMIEESGKGKTLKKLAKVANGHETMIALGHAFEAVKHNI